MKIIIHIGPPKSGTSAIQHWLSNNIDFLFEYGVYYPAHDSDLNGISSGNVLSVFDRTEDNSLIFNNNKVEKLLVEVNESNCDTLLLSSEFFSLHITELVECFPSATFVGYIRFPLDVIESSYNQGIKRHYETNNFGIAKEPGSYHMDLLSKAINKHGRKRFILRPYLHSLFLGNDIVVDFLSVVDNSIIIKKRRQLKINPSYCAEAMEFKRWLNFLPIEHLQQKIDEFLQGYNEGVFGFSLLKEERYLHYKTYFLAKTEAFCVEYEVDNSSDFINALSEKKIKPFASQNLSEKQFNNIIDALFLYDKNLVMTLGELLKKSPKVMEYRPLYTKLFLVKVSLPFYQRLSFTSIKQYLKEMFSKFKPVKYDDKITNLRKHESAISIFRENLGISNDVNKATFLIQFSLLLEDHELWDLAYSYNQEALKLRPFMPLLLKRDKTLAIQIAKN